MNMSQLSPLRIWGRFLYTFSFFVNPVHGLTSNDGLYELTETSGNAMITQYLGCDANVTIPSVVDSIYAVKAIGDSALRSNASLASVSMGSGGVFIGSHAVKDCSSLTGLVLPDGVNIGTSAFQDCSSPTKVIIGSGVTFVDEFAVSNCSSLQEIYYLGVSVASNSLAFENSINSTVCYFENVKTLTNPCNRRPTVAR